MDIKVRLAQELDLDVVNEMYVKLERVYGREMMPEEIKENRVEIMAGIKNNLVWVAETAGKVMGFIRCELLDEHHRYFPSSIFISELWVDDQYRKLGVGSKLVQKILDWDWPKKYTHFSLTHSPTAKQLTGFYEKFGFKKIGLTDVGNVMMIRGRF